jgi:TPR repeat protein
MNETIFWQLIAESKLAGGGNSEAQVAALQERLQTLPEPDIVEFDRLLHEQLDRSYHRDLWAAAYIINGGCSDDGFDYFRAWLIAQGQEVFERALQDPESLVEIAEPEVELELFMYAPVKAYEAVTNQEFPYPARARRELTGDAWEETAECLQKKFPKLFAKFWHAAEQTNESGSSETNFGTALAALQELAGLGGGEASSAEALYTQAAFLAMDESPENLQKAAEMLEQAADQGHAGAQYLLGTCLQEGRGIAQDLEAAAKYFRLAAEQGDGDACAGLGHLFQEGLGVPVNYAEARKWYRQGVEAEAAEAAAGLGVLYAEGLGVKQNAKESLKWFRRAAQDGHEQAANNLGIAYFNGLGVNVDYAEAAKWFAQAVEAGFSEAQYNLGVLHEHGQGVPKDFAKAAELYRAAADQGHANAQSNLGLLHANGTGVPQDYQKAAELYQQAAELGNLVALSNLAVLYQNGRGVSQDLTEAVRLYRRVAEAGVAAGQFNLGTMYERGLGVKQNFEEALRWYRLAAEQGMAAAQNNIGDFYETGRGVEPDFVQAAKWYRKAANQGVSLSQLSLGDFHRKGQGVEQDFAAAARWYQRAAAQGLEPAAQRLEEMYRAGEVNRPGEAKERKPVKPARKPAAKIPTRKITKSKDTPEPPTAQAVARRALCLRALIRRSQIEAFLVVSRKSPKAKTKFDPKALAAEARQLNAWLKDEELWTAVSGREKLSLKKKPGTWTARELKDWGWRTEAFSIIAWALGLAPRIAPYDKQQGEAAYFKKVALLRPTKTFIARSRLRPEARIRTAREIAEAWLWRARTTMIQKEPKKYPPPKGWTYEKIIKAAAQHWRKQGLFKAIKGDYPAFGKSYAKLTEDEWQSCRSIATERLYGLNWLCGYAADWDRVPTGT